MKQYVLFLRGINVGGRTMISMATLKELLIREGYAQVETYLNSGNILLETIKKPEATSHHIEQLINQAFGLTISVFVKSKKELSYIVANNPFDPETEADNAKRMVFLFNEAIIPGSEWIVFKDDKEDADYYIKENLLYIYYKVGAGRAKIVNPAVKQFFRHTTTSRNWNTINKILGRMKSC